MQIAATSSINPNPSVWATSSASTAPDPARDPMTPQDSVTLSSPPDTPQHAPQFSVGDPQPDMIAGPSDGYNPAIQKQLKQQNLFLDKQLSQDKHFVKLNADGSKIGFATKNVNGDNVLYTGEPVGAGMGVDGALKYEKSDDGHLTRTTYETSRPVLMQFRQNADGTQNYTTPPAGVFTPVRVDR